MIDKQGVKYSKEKLKKKNSKLLPKLETKGFPHVLRNICVASFALVLHSLSIKILLRFFFFSLW